LGHRAAVTQLTVYEASHMQKFCAAFLSDEEGMTMVEYAVAGSLVVATVAFTFTTLGNTVITAITTLIQNMN
jgi:pilus assembly protein Flp/PilA